MKKSIFIIALISIFVVGKAQVVIDYHSHAPIKGDVVNFSEAAFVDPGQSGKNVIWDFSKVVFTGKSSNSMHFEASDAIASVFNVRPTNILEENGNKYFHVLNSNSYSIIGITNEDFVVNYDSPVTRMTYPFSFTNRIEGNIKGVATYKGNSQINISGNYSVVSDAYGVILLPGGIKKNVLRVTNHTLTIEASMCSDVTIESTKYTWYSAEDRYPVATILVQEQRYTDGRIVKKEETWINDNVLKQNQPAVNNIAQNTLNQQDVKFNVFPNPFKESVQISYSLPNESEVSLAIYGMLGNKISTIQKKTSNKAGSYIHNLNNSELNLNPGLYFIRLEVNGQVYISKIVKN